MVDWSDSAGVEEIMETYHANKKSVGISNNIRVKETQGLFSGYQNAEYTLCHEKYVPPSVTWSIASLSSDNSTPLQLRSKVK